MQSKLNQDLLGNFFEQIHKENTRLLNEKRSKYGYDFELDIPLRNSKVKSVSEAVSKKSEPTSTKVMLPGLTSSLELNEGKEYFKEEAKKHLRFLKGGLKIKSAVENIRLRVASDLDNK